MVFVVVGHMVLSFDCLAAGCVHTQGSCQWQLAVVRFLFLHAGFSCLVLHFVDCRLCRSSFGCLKVTVVLDNYEHVAPSIA